MWGKNYWKLDILSSRVIGVIIQELYKVSIYKLVDSGHSRLTKKTFVLCTVRVNDEWVTLSNKTLLANFMFCVDQNTTWLGYGGEQMFFIRVYDC